MAFPQVEGEGWESADGVLMYGILGKMGPPYGQPDVALYCMDDGSLRVWGLIIQEDVGGIGPVAGALDRLALESSVMRIEASLDTDSNGYTVRAVGIFTNAASLAPVLVGEEFIVVRAMNNASPVNRKPDETDISYFYPAPSPQAAQSFLERCASVAKRD